MKRTASILIALVTACGGKADNPTPPNTKLTTWSRTSAVLHDMKAPDFRGKEHPLAKAKVLGEPTKRTFTVRVGDPEKGAAFAFDAVVESAKVSWKDPDSDAERERWATLGVEITLVENERYEIKSSCDDKVAYVLGAPGDITNTVLSCDVVGKRPNRMGNKDAITVSAPMQIEGTGKLESFGSDVTVTEKK